VKDKCENIDVCFTERVVVLWTCYSGSSWRSCVKKGSLMKWPTPSLVHNGTISWSPKACETVVKRRQHVPNVIAWREEQRSRSCCLAI